MTESQTRPMAFGLMLACLAAGALSPAMNAQTTYGSIVGTATDPTGASVPNVEVTVTNEETGVAQTRTTNELGAYSFTTLYPGSYAIHAEASGFRPVDIRQIVLQVNQTARFDLAMEVGQVTEIIEVVAAAPVLATDTSDVGHVVANREILDLPLNGRSYLQLAGLTNGVVTFGSAGGDNAGPRFTSQGTRITATATWSTAWTLARNGTHIRSQPVGRRDRRVQDHAELLLRRVRAGHDDRQQHRQVRDKRIPRPIVLVCPQRRIRRSAPV